jgi:thymidylate synthase
MDNAGWAFHRLATIASNRREEPMQQYLELVDRILTTGERTSNRTGVDTLCIFGAMSQYDLRKGFPLLTTKKVLFDTVVDELLWFLRGGHNVNDTDAPKRIWDDWADKDGELGRIYGVQWRQWKGYDITSDIQLQTDLKFYDQLQLAIQRVKKTPNNRRNLVSAWNVAELEQGLIGFPPCHVMFQLRVMEGGTRLDLAMYQRSCDMALGIPFNIASYALLLAMVANECGLQAGVFTHFLADAHVYLTHVETLRRQLQRTPLPLPRVQLPPGEPVLAITKEDIRLDNYHHHGFLPFEVAV